MIGKETRGISSIHGKRIVAFGVFLLFLVIVFLTIPVTYAINDDVAMKNIASGALSGQPDYHLVFVKAVLGMVLSAAYRCVSEIDWYGCFWMGFILFSEASVLWKLLSMYGRTWRQTLAVTAVFLVSFTLTVLPHLVSFQFTVVPAILTGAAIFLYYLDEDEGKKGWQVTGLIILMLWLAFCIRTYAVLMVAPFGGLLFLYKKESFRKKAAMVLIGCAGVAGILFVETKAYSGQDWQTYLTYNHFRSMVYDYYGVPEYAENEDFYQEIGLEEYDVTNLERYNLTFVDGLDTGKMQQIAEYAKQKYQEQTTLSSRVKTAIKSVILAEVGEKNLSLNLLAKLLIFLNLLAGLRKKWMSFWLNVGFLAIEGILFLYLGYQGRLPDRVVSALLFVEFMSALAVFLKEQGGEEKAFSEKLLLYRRGLTAGLMVLLLCLAVWQFREVQSSQKELYRANLEYEELQNYCQEQGGNVYFISSYWIAGYTENFQIKKENRLINLYGLGGWNKFLPVQKEGQRYFGIKDEDAALVENSNTYLILNRQSDTLNAHYKEEYGEITWTEVGTAPVYGMEISVFQLSEDN